MLNLQDLQTLLRDKFLGRLHIGSHPSQDHCCILEFASYCKSRAWTDNPDKVGYPDFRDLNDATWASPQARAEHMLPLLVAFDWWECADEQKRKDCAEMVVARVITKIGQVSLLVYGRNAEYLMARCMASIRNAADMAAAESWRALKNEPAPFSERDEVARAASEEVLVLACRILCEEGESFR